jgi:hypothetical protein
MYIHKYVDIRTVHRVFCILTLANFYGSGLGLESKPVLGSECSNSSDRLVIKIMWSQASPRRGRRIVTRNLPWQEFSSVMVATT